tara:strand:- start:1221 stop:2636 length:1416 start_codon:yes stop_codon:yes gene_type:complete
VIVQQRAAKDYVTALQNTYGSNFIHPLAGCVFVVSFIWSFFAPRRYLLWPIIMIACLISPAQRFAVMGLDFHFLRAISFVMLIRVLVFRDLKDVRFGKADAFVVGLMLTIILCTLVRAGFNPALSACGKIIEPFSLYFVGRALVRTLDDVRYMLVGVSLIGIPVAISFTVEQYTRYNFFSVFGGIPEMTVIRDGKLRSQGSFVHPITAGVFWASFSPLFISQILTKHKSFLILIIGWVGFAVCIVCALMTNSSTSIAGLLIGLAGWCFYRFRNNLRTIFWFCVFVGAFLHFGSQSGLHGLIFTRISFVSGSTGYHRYMLFEGLLNNAQKWFLMGTNDRMFNRSFIDICNHYVLVALDGGIVALTLQIAIIIMAFKAVGRALKASSDRSDSLLIFGLGVAFLTAIASFTAVSSMGEGVIPLFLFAGIMITLGDPAIGLKNLGRSKNGQNGTFKTGGPSSNSGKSPFTGRAQG